MRCSARGTPLRNRLRQVDVYAAVRRHLRLSHCARRLEEACSCPTRGSFDSSSYSSRQPHRGRREREQRRRGPLPKCCCGCAGAAAAAAGAPTRQERQPHPRSRRWPRPPRGARAAGKQAAAPQAPAAAATALTCVGSALRPMQPVPAALLSPVSVDPGASRATVHKVPDRARRRFIESKRRRPSNMTIGAGNRSAG